MCWLFGKFEHQYVPLNGLFYMTLMTRPWPAEQWAAAAHDTSATSDCSTRRLVRFEGRDRACVPAVSGLGEGACAGEKQQAPK